MIRPRQPLHRGHVGIGGFLLDPAAIGEAEARRRVLALWGPGVEVSETPGGWFLRVPPRLQRAEAAIGLPLVLTGGVWWAAPLSPAEREALAPGQGAIVRVRAGVAVVDHPPFRALDPSTWLDVESWSVTQVTSLGAPPPVAQLPEVADVRAALDIARLDPRAAAVAAALTAIGSGHGAFGSPSAATRGLAKAVGGALSLLQRLRALLGNAGSAAAPPTAPAAPPAAPGAPAEPPAPGLWDRLEGWLARWMASTGLLALLERQHAAYLQKMMDLFESGDLLEALRYAIPLGGEGHGALGPAWRPPSPRDQLRITRGGAATRGLGMSLDLLAHVRGLYESAWKRLVAMGRIEEAAFVLAELLQREEEAVQLLETHGLLQKAAEVAEARGLAPGLVVRQWWIAGDHDRALAVARRSGAFADALVRLEKTDAIGAVALRVAWAVALAEAGDHAQAVEVIWRIEPARPRALIWMDEAIAAGGTLGAAMCVRKLSVAPESLPDVRDAVLAALSDEDRSALPVRRALYEALLAVPANPAIAAIARPIARAALRDLPELDAERAWITRVIDVAADPVLRADCAALPHRVARAIPLADRDSPTTIAFTDDEAGALPAVDVVPLSGGKLLVALGEAGVRLVARDGRTLRHWDQPATQLVANPQANRVITVVGRGDWARLGRIDLSSGRGAHWADADFAQGAPAYDGSIWYVAQKDAILGIDALADSWRSLWRVGDLGGQPGALSWSPKHLAFVVTDDKAPGTLAFERWSYELPGPRLRSREATPQPQAVVGAHTTAWFHPEGGGLVARTEGPASARYDLEYRNDTAHRKLTLSPDEAWLAVSFGHGPQPVVRGGRVVLFRVGTPLHKALLLFDGTAPTVVRFGEEALVVATPRGHLVTLDLRSGAALRRLRLS